MNIQNISGLTNQLMTLGFGDLGFSLAKRIALKPENFLMQVKIEKENDIMQAEIFIQNKDDLYNVQYYDATLQQNSFAMSEELNGINIPMLEKKMLAIDWKNAFELDEQKPWNEKAELNNEQAVESAISDLKHLETMDEGKAIASLLKLKYWAGANYYDIFGVITAPKAKAEISQRFFIFDGQPGISVDEAYRFLQNRRMEKLMKRKQADEIAKENDSAGEASNSGNGLLKKKRINPATKRGKNKATA